MARQVRSEATRRKILDAAVDVFNEVGYATADRGAIIERTGMTKGAFYHHFDSMEALASAIIEEGANLVVTVLGAMSDSFSPALENILHGTFITADLFASNKVVRTAEQLTLAFGKFNDTAAARLHQLGRGDDRCRPGGQSPKATSERSSTRKWSASRSSAQRSAPGYWARRRQAAATTSSGD